MKYTKEQRLDIGRRIYSGEISKYKAAEIYDISYQTAREYMRLYRNVNHLPPKRGRTTSATHCSISKIALESKDLETYQSMSKEELIQELVKARIAEVRLKKRLRGERGWFSHSLRQQEYLVIMELSGEFPVKLLCETMGVNRSSFYYWKKRLGDPSPRTKNLIDSIQLFQEYHMKYPSHGYRWLNAKIHLDKGLIMSDPFAHKCCKIAGIKSKSKHYRYKEPGDPGRVFPNLLSAELNIDGPLQCIVSDMTAFYVKGVYYKLTLYMDLWNNEIVSHAQEHLRIILRWNPLIVNFPRGLH